VPDRVAPLDRVSTTIWLEPIGLDVLDDLASADPGNASAIQALRDAMPRVSLGTVRDSDGGAGAISLDWTRDRATATCADGTRCHVTPDGRACLYASP
jgi:hypothetical protein